MSGPGLGLGVGLGVRGWWVRGSEFLSGSGLGGSGLVSVRGLTGFVVSGLCRVQGSEWVSGFVLGSAFGVGNF